MAGSQQNDGITVGHKGSLKNEITNKIKGADEFATTSSRTKSKETTTLEGGGKDFDDTDESNGENYGLDNTDVDDENDIITLPDGEEKVPEAVWKENRSKLRKVIDREAGRRMVVAGLGIGSHLVKPSSSLATLGDRNEEVGDGGDVCKVSNKYSGGGTKKKRKKRKSK
mmetsp:Transcript_40253/g.94615  ORF Transcript_40253/g.94615 Transcript_40253/m.94615 type:complete len:169 (+) Transcript_40253:634-1140(+)